jgi:hypothetical protein
MSGAEAVVAWLVSRVAAWGEQQVRAHPRLNSAFFSAVQRHPLLRSAAGWLKLRVRRSIAKPRAGFDAAAEDRRVQLRREAGVRVRLGLPTRSMT